MEQKISLILKLTIIKNKNKNQYLKVYQQKKTLIKILCMNELSRADNSISIKYLREKAPNIFCLNNFTCREVKIIGVVTILSYVLIFINIFSQMDQYIMNKYYNHYMEKIILIFSFVLICWTKQETLKIKQSYLSYLPDIKDNYSIAAQMLRAQKQQQRQKAKPSPNNKPVIAPNPVINNNQVHVEPPASKPEIKVVSDDTSKRVQQKQNSQKDIKSEPAFGMISKTMQFAQSNYAPNLKEPRTYKLNKIDDSSVLDAQGNIAKKSPDSQIPTTTINQVQTNLKTKVQVQQQKIVTKPIESQVREKIEQKPQPKRQEQKQVGEVDLQRKPIKVPARQNKIQSKETQRQDEQQENRQAGNFRKKVQNNQKNQVKNNKEQNINENFTYSRALFVILFGLSALVIIFGYTPQKKERRYVPQEMDQQQSSLR